MSKSVYKKMEAMQEKMASKFGADPKVNPLTVGWMFNTWYEKIILIVLMVLGIWKLGGFFF